MSNKNDVRKFRSSGGNMTRRPDNDAPKTASNGGNTPENGVDPEAVIQRSRVTAQEEEIIKGNSVRRQSALAQLSKK